MKRLRRSFYAADAPDVAPQLLGKLLVVGPCTGRITEVEAYMQHDPASHTFRGRTKRNAVMFEPGGRLYVYFTYGMHCCANVTTGPRDHGQAVLLRAVDPIAGIDEMVRRRGRATNIADGPGKLCQAFGIDLADSGVDVCTSPDIGLYDDGTPPPTSPLIGPRIGIRVGVDTPWRWRVPPPG